MADLSTLDSSQPDNTDLASAGASEIRGTRVAILTSFGIEHHLTGEHKFLVGNTASRPTAGKAGRIYFNTELNTMQRDDGAAWIDVTTRVNPGGSIAGFNNVVNDTTVAISTTETVVAEVSLTTLDILHLTEIQFSIGGFYAPVINNPSSMTVRIREDGTAGVANGTIKRTANQIAFNTPAGTLTASWSVTLNFANFLSAALHRYKLTVQANSADINWSRNNVYGKMIEYA